MTNRRGFLKNASIITMGGLMVGKSGQVTANSLSSANVNAAKNIGLQIYSLYAELMKDVPGGLKKIAQMGYSTIELAGYGNGRIDKFSMADFKKMSDDAGLKIVSSHLNPPTREYTPESKNQIMEFWKKAADEHAAIGVTLLIQPGQPFTRTIEEVAYVGEIFNGAGQIVKASGLSFGYHNHDGEFARVRPAGAEPEAPRTGGGGERPRPVTEIIYEGMLKNTDPSLVFFELDVYWCVMGKEDPVDYMKRYADRIKVLHIKDRAVLGQSGMMNFEMIFKQAYANGIKDFFVELENVSRTGLTQFEAVKECADYLINASFVK